jgi:hypothetical protein
MSANKSHDTAVRKRAADDEEMHETQAGGSGAASALERMKAEHAMRHKRQHGKRATGPGHEEDPIAHR